MGYQSALAGNWTVAQNAFGLALRDDLRNPQLQFLNALAYDRLGHAGDPASIELARVGYQNTVSFDPGNYWALLQLGYLELDQADYASAQDAFARAVRDQPQRWEAVYGLGVASYYIGDVAMAVLAARKAQQLAPDHPSTRRLLAFSLAAAGDSAALGFAHEASGPADAVWIRRVSEVLREAQLPAATLPAAGVAESATVPAVASPDDPQVVIDVTIILSSQVRNESRGINLLDGLKLQYGYTNSFTSTRPSGGDRSSQRTITSNIGIPQLTYSLNLFNNSGQSYQVLARPTLTAYVGRESEFFAGRTITVGISGINLGTLQPIDVGVGLKVTPERIDGDTITFRVNATRSFLSKETVGSFEESLTTFKQLVQATAEVDFGQTLLLSALSERVRDATYSKTPGIGDIPGPSILFNDRKALTRTESLLILVTPMRPTTFATKDRQTSAAVQQLASAWRQWIDPSSDVEAVLQRLQSQRFFSGAEHGDLKWGTAVTPALLKQAMDESLQLAAR